MTINLFSELKLAKYWDTGIFRLMPVLPGIYSMQQYNCKYLAMVNSSDMLDIQKTITVCAACTLPGIWQVVQCSSVPIYSMPKTNINMLSQIYQIDRSNHKILFIKLVRPVYGSGRCYTFSCCCICTDSRNKVQMVRCNYQV